MPVDLYFGAPHGRRPWPGIADASLWRFCAAILHISKPGVGIEWTTLRLPYDIDTRGNFQGNQEYLVLLLRVILTLAYRILHSPDEPHIYYKWITDNTEALKWASDKNTPQ